MQLLQLWILILCGVLAMGASNEQRLACINESAKSKLNEVDTFCKGDMNHKPSCHESFYGMKLCLIQNECYLVKPSQNMPSRCWDCWASFESKDDTILTFQSLIRSKCYSYSPLILLSLLLSLLLNI